MDEKMIILLHFTVYKFKTRIFSIYGPPTVVGTFRSVGFSILGLTASCYLLRMASSTLFKLNIS